MSTQLTIDLPKLTPKQMASLFWDMNDDEQGKFFDELGQLVLCTPSPFTREIGSMFGLDMQMCYASGKATALGQDAMSRFSDQGTMRLRPNHRQEIEDALKSLHYQGGPTP